VFARQQGAEVATDEGGAAGRIDAHARIIVRLEMRLVLQRQREDRDPFALHRAQVAAQVAGEGVISVGFERTLDQAVAALHPARCAPGRGHDLQLRIDRQRALDGRQHRGAMRIDGKACQRRIAFATRHVVEAVVALRKVRGADGQAREGHPESAIAAEQLAQQAFALRRVHALLDQKGRGVGDRGAEALDFLEARGGVDVDDAVSRLGAAEMKVGAARHQFAPVACRQPGLDGAAAVLGRCLRNVRHQQGREDGAAQHGRCFMHCIGLLLLSRRQKMETLPN